MNTEIFDMMGNVSEKAYQTAQKWGEINLRVLDRWTQQQLDLFENSVEKGSERVQRVMQSKDYKDLVAAQTELAKEVAATAVDQARKTTALFTETRDAMSQLFQQGIDQAAAEIKKVTPKK